MLEIEFRKASRFNWRIILVKLLGRYEWVGEPGSEDAGYVKRLGNWAYIVSDEKLEEARRKLRNEIEKES